MGKRKELKVVEHMKTILQLHKQDPVMFDENFLAGSLLDFLAIRDPGFPCAKEILRDQFKEAFGLTRRTHG